MRPVASQPSNYFLIALGALSVAQLLTFQTSQDVNTQKYLVVGFAFGLGVFSWLRIAGTNFPSPVVKSMAGLVLLFLYVLCLVLFAPNFVTAGRLALPYLIILPMSAVGVAAGAGSKPRSIITLSYVLSLYAAWTVMQNWLIRRGAVALWFGVNHQTVAVGVLVEDDSTENVGNTLFLRNVVNVLDSKIEGFSEK